MPPICKIKENKVTMSLVGNEVMFQRNATRLGLKSHLWGLRHTNPNIK